jgi:hypothetical protein
MTAAVRISAAVSRPPPPPPPPLLLLLLSSPPGATPVQVIGSQERGQGSLREKVTPFVVSPLLL